MQGREGQGLQAEEGRMQTEEGRRVQAEAGGMQGTTEVGMQEARLQAYGQSQHKSRSDSSA
jgi:hypothetical protein